MDGEEDADQPIASLPRELLSYIFSLLDVTERSFASHVCRRWRAAALEPPHSTTLSLRLRHDWQVDEDTAQIETCTLLTASSWEGLDRRLQTPEVRAYICPAWAPDPTALTEAEMRLALCSPLARDVATLSIALGRAAGAPPAAAQDADGGVRLVGIRRWPVRALLEALPASVTSLEVRHSEFEAPGNGMYTIERDLLFGQLDALQELAPQLRELTLRNINWVMMEASPWAPKHAGLERLDAESLELTDRMLFDDMPSLRRITSHVVFDWPLQSGPEDVCRALAALAERGLRVRSLSLLNEDLRHDGMVEALSTIFDPAAVGPGRRPARLLLRFDSLPEGGLPEGFGTGAEEIECHGSPRRSILPWITAISRRPCLRLLELFITDLLGFSTRELLAALQGCRDGLRITLKWKDFQPAKFAEACSLVMKDRDLLRATTVDMCGSFHNAQDDAGAEAALAAYWRYQTEQLEAFAERGALSRDERLRALGVAADIHHAMLDRIGRPEPMPTCEEGRGSAPPYGEMLRRVLECAEGGGEDAEVDRARSQLLSGVENRVYVIG